MINLLSKLPKRIVVLTRAGLGDTVYVIPALRVLRQRFRHAHITVITGERGYPLLVRCPYIDQLHLRHLGKGLKGKFQEVWRLRRGHYDLAVILDTSDEKTLHTFLAGIPYRAGGVKKRFKSLLTHPYEVSEQAHQINDLCRGVVETIGCDTSDWHLELFPRPEAHATMLQKLQSTGWRGQRPLIGVNPGASAPNKQWFPERFAQVVDALIKGGAEVVLLGAHSDKAQVDAVLERTHYTPRVLSGQLDLDELIFCLKTLDILISGDTGPSHMAGAVGTPIVALFGPSKAAHYAPLGAPHIAIDRSHLCAPTCSFWTCRGDNLACMRAISALDVLEAVKALHSAKRGDT